MLTVVLVLCQLSTGSSQKFSRAVSKDTPKGSKWKETEKKRADDQGTKATWHQSCKESQEREEDIWTQAEELRTQGSKDDRNRKFLVDGFRRFKKMRDEEEEQKKTTEALVERRRIREDEL